MCPLDIPCYFDAITTGEYLPETVCSWTLPSPPAGDYIAVKYYGVMDVEGRFDKICLLAANEECMVFPHSLSLTMQRGFGWEFGNANVTICAQERDAIAALSFTTNINVEGEGFEGEIVSVTDVRECDNELDGAVFKVDRDPFWNTYTQEEWYRSLVISVGVVCFLIYVTGKWCYETVTDCRNKRSVYKKSHSRATAAEAQARAVNTAATPSAPRAPPAPPGLALGLDSAVAQPLKEEDGASVDEEMFVYQPEAAPAYEEVVSAPPEYAPEPSKPDFSEADTLV